jgi:hypothetical protein
MNSIGVHPYELPPVNPDPNAPGSTFKSALDQARNAAAAHNDAGRALSITEFGYYVGQVTEAQQASGDMSAFQLAAGMSDVNMFLIHSLFGQFGSQNDSSGVCSAPGVPRAAAHTFKQFFSANPTAYATC